MAKIIRTYRLSEEVDQLIKAEAARLSTSKKVSEADVIEIAVVAWLSRGDETDSPADVISADDRRNIAESAMRDAEEKTPSPEPTVPRRAESVAQRRARESKEHAEKLAQSDVVAQLTGRNDIEYDLENVPHQSAFNVALQTSPPVKHHYDVQPRKVKPLTRPNGTTEAKRRREQG